MKTGSQINAILKNLGANGTATSFVASTTPPPAGITPEILSNVSSSEPTEVKAWLDGTTIKYYAQGYTDSNTRIPLNADSESMFNGCSSLTSLNLSGFDTSNVTTMESMFKGCSSLTSLNVSGFDTSNVTTMKEMFSHCSSLTNLNVSGFDTSNVNWMQSMFSHCSSLTSLNLSNFNTSNVTGLRMQGMFSYCSSLTSLDLSSFDTSNVTDVLFLFYDCSRLETIYASSSFVNTNMSYNGASGAPFTDCYALKGGAGTAYNSNMRLPVYARIDDPAHGRPGYFTEKP